MKPKVTTFDIAGMVAEAKTLNKPFRTPKGPKKFSVYVKNEKGNIVKVNFGDPNMEIKRDDPERRKNFRARHLHECLSLPITLTDLPQGTGKVMYQFTIASSLLMIFCKRILLGLFITTTV